MDNERLTWLRVYGIPCHAWSPEVFDFISKPVGTYVCSDGDTNKHTKMNVARILIIIKYSFVLNETYNIGSMTMYFVSKLWKIHMAPCISY